MIIVIYLFFIIKFSFSEKILYTIYFLIVSKFYLVFLMLTDFIKKILLPNVMI